MQPRKASPCCSSWLYPAGYRDWPTLIFRPYHVDGPQAEQAIDRIFADPTIEMIHSRNVYAACYMFSIHRPVDLSYCMP